MRRVLLQRGTYPSGWKLTLLSPTFEPGARHHRYGLRLEVRRPAGHTQHTRIVECFIGRPHPDLRHGGVGTLTVEAKTWRAWLHKSAGPGSSAGRKVFIRLKVGTGGKRG